MSAAREKSTILTDEHKASYAQNGYFVIEDALSAEEVDRAKQTLVEVSQEFHRGCLSDDETYTRECGREIGGDSGDVLRTQDHQCVLQLERNCYADEISNDEVQYNYRKLFQFHGGFHPVFDQLIHHANIQGVVEELLSEEVQLFQSMALSKPPHIGSEKPWHQDNAYFSFVPLNLIVGVWIALDHATRENGCMELLSSPQDQFAYPHCHIQDCEIDRKDIDTSESKAVELEPGGALFFFGMVPHRTAPNTSDLPRKAFQFHYRANSTYQVSAEEYDKVFVNQSGQASSCRAAINRS